jgi:hypothetical protein
MSFIRLCWGVLLLSVILLGGGLLGCAEMREGDADLPGRVTRGMQGGGQLGGSPSGVFEPR